MAVSLDGGLLLVGILVMRALLAPTILSSISGPSDFWKLSYVFLVEFYSMPYPERPS